MRALESESLPAHHPYFCGNMKIDKDLALFYGILLGDGCISRSGNKWFVVITCSFYDDKKFFNKVVIPIAKRLRGKDVRYRERKEYGKLEINFSDKNLFKKLNSIGFPIGKKFDINIPKIFFDYNLEKYVIAGIFATDGSLALVNNNGTFYPRIEIKINSFKLLYQIKKYLIKNGLKGNIYKVNGKYGITYRLEFPGKHNLLEFEKKVGLINPKQWEKFKGYTLTL